MNNTIDAAIDAHRSWAARLKLALGGNNTEALDLSKVKDDTDCFLGRWLLTNQASEWLGDRRYSEIVTFHRMFHELAGSLAERIKRYDSRENIATITTEFDNLSKQLIQTLMQAKTKF